MLEACAAGNGELACARSRGRSHPVFGLWSTSLLEDLRQAVIDEEIRKVDRWTTRYRLVEVDFPDFDGPKGPVDPFFNTNRPEDLKEAEEFL